MLRIISLRIWALIALLAFVLGSAATPNVYAQSDNAAYAQIINEYQRGLDELKDHFKVVRGKVLHISEKGDGKVVNVKEESIIDFSRTTNSSKYIYTNMSKKIDENFAKRINSQKAEDTIERNEIVLCYNPTYAFELSRDGKNKEYAITYFDEKIDFTKTKIERGFVKFADPSLYFGISPISKLIIAPSFKVAGVENVKSQNNKSLKKISFTIDRSRSQAGIDKKVGNSKDTRLVYAVESGWFLVSPEEHWSLYSYDLLLKANRPNLPVKHRSGRIEYSGQSDGFPTPKKITTQNIGDAEIRNELGVNTQEPFIHDETIEFQEIAYSAPNDKEFYSEAFGLPDLSKPKKQTQINLPSAAFFVLATLAGLTSLIMKIKEKNS